jgi:hypothetical protein
MEYNYIMNGSHSVKINDELIISNDDLLKAINFCNGAIQALDAQTRQFDINIFEVLGMRNLSGMVGEYFAKSVQRFANNGLQSNLHQDGYPDLLLTNTPERLSYFNTLYTEVDGKNILKIKLCSVLFYTEELKSKQLVVVHHLPQKPLNHLLVSNV